jgi:hypothetical protein
MRLRPAAVGFALAIVAFATAPADSQESLAGAWNGSGTITLPSGNTEKARCRATFRSAGRGATMAATCATASVRVQQVAELDRVAPGRYRGDFRNMEYGISGTIRIAVSGNSLTASLNSGGGGSAVFNLSR